MSRPASATVGEVVAALVGAPYVEELGTLIEGSRVGRRRKHPGWVPLTYVALARHFHSANHLDAELTDGLWDELRRAASARGLADPGPSPYLYAQHAYWRSRAVDDDAVLADLLAGFTTLAIEHARESGLLLARGQGSLTHPSPRRTIYGDGTVVRPIYRQLEAKVGDEDECPAGVPDEPGEPRAPGELDELQASEQTALDSGDETASAGAGDEEQEASGPVRVDPSAAVYHRHDGAIYGNNFVIVSARHDIPGSRIVLGIDWVTAPGREADTAVGLIGRVVQEAGPGIQAVVYDGALMGVHIDRLMRTSGLVVINKVAAASRKDGKAVPKRRALARVEHQVGTRICAHSLHTEDGQVIDVGLADDGSPKVLAVTRRHQVKRTQRGDGTYRFNVAVEVPCPKGAFTIWLSPHATGDRDTTPEHVRLIPPGDPDFARLYGMRNDAESFNASFKRSLLVDRASSVGWRRQLFDLLGYVVLANSLAWLRLEQSSTALSA